MGRTRLARKIEALLEANAEMRGKLKTVRADLATRDSTLEELEGEVDELRRENEELLSVDDIPSDTGGMDMSDESEQDDDDLLGEEEDPEEVLFNGESDEE